MEAVKQRCFQKILEQNNLSVDDFKRAIAPLDAIEQFYEDSRYGYHMFEEMVIRDGCFIVQLIRKVYPEDDILNFGRIQTDIRVDLLLLENQLPFFVLFKLYGVIVPNAGVDIAAFADMALKSLFDISFDCPLKNDIFHLLDLVHSCHLPSPQGIKVHKDFKAKAAAGAREAKPKRLWNFIRCATELEDAGIKFEKTENQRKGIDYSFDIMFPKGTNVLRIPTLTVSDSTERTLRNYMAYEQFVSSGEPTYFSDYVLFMDNLIDTGKDVQLLCNSGIIDNWLGDDEVVAKMINHLGDSIYYSQEFYYAEIYCRVNKHCQRKRNKWMAALRRDYFHNPWSIISFFAAVVLLLLTSLQTIFSVLSYYKQ
ncbi:hypothetical protein F3Y22_tig00112349pilonHSYRG00112 [Hibiscus syriacus]|uniref:Uncharacterized protein n=2 Tax=Hibiscus syriacus TaxID=106335 RepID=A0A6A2XZD2_HIBSY|nr:hypothetical protein F3Y22_tig00112349pilonHSYRG00112 [Hibiscus syriacus]